MRLALLALTALLIGCAPQRKPQPLQPDTRPVQHTSSAPQPATAPATPKPYVLHLPGVSGTSMIDYAMRDGLRAGGIDGEFVIHDWVCGDPGIPALHNLARNHEQAKLVAEKLTAQYRAHPQTPIYLTCHSGGSGPATWALESLPADVKIQTFVMFAPALSPTYDLTKALTHVTQNLYCFSSTSDDLVLGTGTKMFGTIDGQRVEAAGKVGFQKPPGADETQYAKIISKPYESTWVRFGHIGGHIGCMTTPFVRAIVAPILLGRQLTADQLKAAESKIAPDVLWPK